MAGKIKGISKVFLIIAMTAKLTLTQNAWFFLYIKKKT
jgi:hypothetical protein